MSAMASAISMVTAVTTVLATASATVARAAAVKQLSASAVYFCNTNITVTICKQVTSQKNSTLEVSHCVNCELYLKVKLALLDSKKNVDKIS